jgi:hypothetical protein
VGDVDTNGNESANTHLANRAGPPSTLRKIFIGKDGLRAGWSLLIFSVLFAFRRDSMGFRALAEIYLALSFTELHAARYCAANGLPRTPE